METIDAWAPKGAHPTPETIDRWRCDLLVEAKAEEVARHVRGCARCQRVGEFGPRLAAQLHVLPMGRPSRGVQAQARRRWLVLSGLVTAALVLAMVIALPRFVDHYQVGGQSEIADAVRHPDFYEWLARHPELMKETERGNSV